MDRMFEAQFTNNDSPPTDQPTILQRLGIPIQDHKALPGSLNSATQFGAWGSRNTVQHKESVVSLRITVSSDS